MSMSEEEELCACEHLQLQQRHLKALRRGMDDRRSYRRWPEITKYPFFTENTGARDKLHSHKRKPQGTLREERGVMMGKSSKCPQ